MQNWIAILCRTVFPSSTSCPLHKESSSLTGWLIYNGINQFLLNIQQFVVMPRLVINIREFNDKDMEIHESTIDIEMVVFSIYGGDDLQRL
ncbi:hypothetical protein EDB19DRAFT_1713834, partial [Suillus lakei]